MTTTFTLIAPSPAQEFSSLPSGATYRADNNGVIVGVQLQDRWQMMRSGCKEYSSLPSVALSCAGTQAFTFAPSGDIEYNVSLTAACTFSITTPAPGGGFQRLILRIQPNGFQATLPTSSGNLINSGGSAPTPSTSAVTIYTYGYDGTTIDGGI